MSDLGFAIGDLVAVLCGDAREMLRQLPEKSINCCVTSPPFWGLRDYGIAPMVWDGDAQHAHEWVEHVQPAANGLINNTMQGETLSGRSATRKPKRSDFCECGAWLGQLGLEPTPELYVEHIVQVFREVWRVLRDDGTLWLNLGDCYATGAGRVGEHPGGGEQGARWKGDVNRIRDNKRWLSRERLDNGRSVQPTEARKKTRDDSKGRGTPKRADGTGGHLYIGPMQQPNRMPIPGLKPKDLVGIPWRVAFALQADGWYLRSDIIWAKPNPMPESVRDRPTRSHEYVFLLSKSERYYYDADSIQEPVGRAGRNGTKTPDGWDTSKGNGGHGSFHRLGREGKNSRMHVDRDPAHLRYGSGNKTRKLETPTHPNDHRGSSVPWEDESRGRNKRSVWTVATQPYPEAHFATFPEALIEPCILAGCPERGLVLDPFAGSGTTGAVSLKLGRRSILIEPKLEYVELIKRRCDITPNLALSIREE